MRFPLRGAAALLAFVWSAATALGWSADGHAVTGWLADRGIEGSRAEVEVKKLLRPGENLERMSTWADRIKGGAFDADAREYLEANPEHATYHYVNLPFQAKGYAPDGIGARPEDLVQITIRCIKILRGKATPEENPTKISPRHALVILMHSMGDLAQPFHVGCSYIAEVDGKPTFIDPVGWTGGTYHDDWGGNGLLLGPSNLHSYWDQTFVQKAMQRATGGLNSQIYGAWLQKNLPPQEAWRGKGEPETWPIQWADESLALSREAHEGLRLGVRHERPARRAGEEARSTWDVQLPTGYDQRAIEIIHPQLAKAGWRMAQLLRAIWPDPPANEAEARQQALKKFPALGEKGSALNAEFVARHNRYRKEKPAFFKDVSWPLLLAEEAAAALPAARPAELENKKP